MSLQLMRIHGVPLSPVPECDKGGPGAHTGGGRQTVLQFCCADFESPDDK